MPYIQYLKSFTLKLRRQLKLFAARSRARSRAFVILDPRDNSITFSQNLFRFIKKIFDRADDNPPKAFAFFILQTKLYGFCINPSFESPTQIADIQYNSKHKCVGFECLNPTVAKILYDYQLPDIQPYKLSVTPHMTPEYWYFQIERPHHRPQSGLTSSLNQTSS